MTKALIFMCLIFLWSCTSTPALDKRPLFTFDAIKQVFPGNPSQKQILEKFGAPDVKIDQDNKELWKYFDPATRLERVQFTFNESKALTQLLWIPLPGERELNIERIFDQYPSEYFKITNISKSSNHSLQTDTTYSGESVAIFRDDARKEVQAISWFVPTSKERQRRKRHM
jgi:hypothetical protein